MKSVHGDLIGRLAAAIAAGTITFVVFSAVVAHQRTASQRPGRGERASARDPGEGADRAIAPHVDYGGAAGPKRPV